jgi:hypothetical protein
MLLTLSRYFFVADPQEYFSQQKILPQDVVCSANDPAGGTFPQPFY